jgi:hypothetical protein
MSLRAQFNKRQAEYLFLFSPPQGLHSPTGPFQQPFLRGRGPAPWRYLHQNRNTMKAGHKSNVVEALSETRARVHLFLAIFGIITAVISTLVLVAEVNAPQLPEDASASRGAEISKLTTSGMMTKIKSLSEVVVILEH